MRKVYYKSGKLYVREACLFKNGWIFRIFLKGGNHFFLKKIVGNSRKRGRGWLGAIFEQNIFVTYEVNIFDILGLLLAGRKIYVTYMLHMRQIFVICDGWCLLVAIFEQNIFVTYDVNIFVICDGWCLLGAKFEQNICDVWGEYLWCIVVDVC